MKMIQVIHVEPLGHGWAVRHEPASPPQVFSSGAKAEAAALSLGSRLAEAGRPSEIRIYLRGGALGGRYVYPAEA
jgi:hypothetical protein